MKNLTFEEVAAHLDEVYNKPIPEGEREIKMHVVLPNIEAAEKFHTEFNTLMAEEVDRLLCV